MILSSRKAFTLVELMIVIAMIGILAAAMFYMMGPYMNRSRDVKRFTDIQQYGRVIDLYYKDHSALPSVIDPTNPLITSYCADTVFFTRPNAANKPDMQFEELKQLMAGSPLRDPLATRENIYPCDQTGSYLYSSFTGADNKQYSLLGARMSILANGNYLTGADVWLGSVNIVNIPKMTSTYKGTIKDTTQEDSYYFIVTSY